MESKEYVVMLLKNHARMVREIASLKFELKNFAKTDDNEIIEEMTLVTKLGDGIHSGRISDKTADVALRYREVADRVNEEALKAVVHRLDALETAVGRLAFYMSHMEQIQVEVLRGCYFERRTWRDLQDGMNLTVKTLRKIRDTAVASLAEQYALLFSLSVITEGEKKLFP